MALWFSPPTWGWSGGKRCRAGRRQVLPTHVGMVRRINQRTKTRERCTHRNEPHHRHQRSPQKPGKLSLPVRICGIRALISLCPLQAFFLGHRVIRQIEPFGRWQTVQTEDECTVAADQIIGHGPCARMINYPVKWKALASSGTCNPDPCSSTKTLNPVEDSTSFRNPWVGALSDMPLRRY